MAEERHRIRVRILVTGRVQGVFFRATARDRAMRLGISGSARNRPDGSVLIEAEGAPEAVERFQGWCATGPPEAVVEHVQVSAIVPTGDHEFVTG